MGNVKKHFKRKSLPRMPQDEPGTDELIYKLQEQLSAMEKKLDILIGQSSERPFERSYSQKPPRHFDRFNRHDSRGRDNAYRERTYTKVVCADCNTECEIPFKPTGGRPVYCKDCFSKRKNRSPFNANREVRPEGEGFSRQRRFEKRHPGKKKRRKSVKV